MAIIKIRNAAIDLDAAEIPNLPATKITSGTLDNARISLDAAEIPNLDTAKITTGTLADARVPDLNASKITAGTIATARLGSGTANSSTFLRGDNTFASAGQTNTPMFKVSGGNLTLSHNTHTKLTISSEAIDTDNCFDLGSNNRFTPTVAGKYLFILQIQSPTGTNADYINPYIKKNGGSGVAGAAGVQRDYNSVQFASIIEANGSGDYFEAYAEQESGGNLLIAVNEFSAFFIAT